MSTSVDTVAAAYPAAPVTRSRSTLWDSAWAVAGVVFALYGLWLAAMFVRGYDARDSIVLGRMYVTKSHVSTIIKLDPHYHYPANRGGYDGQYFYFIAADPLHARYYVDNASYRYTKILYPAVARTLALGQPGLVPYTLILTNWLAVAAGAGLLAAWLRRKAMSPWFALVYALCPGMWAAFERDLTEPLSYALVVLAIYLLDFGGKYRYVSAGLAFACAILARDKAAIFAGMYGLGLLLNGVPDIVSRLRASRLQSGGAAQLIAGNVLQAGVFGAVALAPYVLWRLFLHHWLHAAATVSGVAGVSTSYESAPLSGVLSSAIGTDAKVMYLFVLFIPAAICAGVALWAVVKRAWTVPVFTLLLLIELSVVSLGVDYFVDVYGVLRVEIGVILAATLCLPVCARLTRANSLWYYAAAAGWLYLSIGYALLAPAWLIAGRA